MRRPSLLLFSAFIVSGTWIETGTLARGDEAPPAEKEATLVQLRIRGSVEDAVPPENPFGPSPFHLRGLLETIRKAKEDPAVAGMILKLEDPSLGLAKAREVIAALDDFKASGKKIYAFAEDASAGELLLLSAASRLTMPESALIVLPGISAESLYFKSFFDRIGIRFLVVPIGDYKSAFENFARDEMSPAFREVLESLVDAVYRGVQEIIASGRKVPPEKVAEAIDRAFLTPEDLKDLGLIDEVADREHFLKDVKADLDVAKLRILTGYGQKSGQIDPQNPFAVFKVLMEALSPPAKRSSSRAKIAIVYASGIILPGKSKISPFSGQVALGSETMVEALRTASDDATVKAIVLRIDSPGGSGTASDAIWRAVGSAREKKPVVASMSDVAGSGGYYIAMGANRILAQPETITGSIGVVSALVNVRKALDLLRIRVERVSRGKNAATLSPFTDPDQVSLEPMRKLLESFYWQFVDKAAAGRGKTRDELHAVAQGRVWTGRAALERGLIDEIGGLQRAIQVARELAGVPGDEKLDTLELPPPPNFFEAFSESLGAARLAGALGLGTLEAGALAAIPELREALARAEALAAAAGAGPLMLAPIEVRIR